MGCKSVFCLTSKPQGDKGRGNTQVRISPWASDSGSCQSLSFSCLNDTSKHTQNLWHHLKNNNLGPRKPELQELTCQWTWKQTGTCETWHIYTCVLQLQTSTGVRFLRFTLMSNTLVSLVIRRRTVGGINHKQAIFSLWNKCVLCSKLQGVVHRY